MFLLSSTLVLAGLVGLQAWHPSTAAAAGGPTAVDDVLHLQANGSYASTAIGYLANDVPGSSYRLLTDFPDDQPNGLKPSADHRTVTFPDGAELTMTGEIPHMEFSWLHPGTFVARYRNVDDDGAASEALVTIVVGPGGGAVLQLKQGHQASVDVLAGDVPGYNADGTPGTLDKTSVHFDKSSGGGYATTVSSDGRTLTDPVRGVFHASSTTGVVTFDPEKTYRGGGNEHVSYVARDTTRAADGTVQHHSYRGNIALWVTTIDPRPVTDAGITVHHASLTLPGVTNDLPGDPSVPLRPELTVFSTTSVNPDGSIYYDHGRGLKVVGTGWWTIDPAGTITFTPVASYSGQVPDVYYQVTDASGTTGGAAVQVYVAPGPAAQADLATTPRDVDVVLDAPKNDTPGQNADLTAGSMDRTSVHFPADGQPSGAVLSRYDRTLSVPGQGVYTADAKTGKITFDPASGFAGKAGPITYSVRDTVHRTDGRVVHNLTEATATVTVSATTRAAAGR